MCYATEFEEIVTRSSVSFEGSWVTRSCNITYYFLIRTLLGNVPDRLNFVTPMCYATEFEEIVTHSSDLWWLLRNIVKGHDVILITFPWPHGSKNNGCLSNLLGDFMKHSWGFIGNSNVGSCGSFPDFKGMWLGMMQHLYVWDLK